VDTPVVGRDECLLDDLLRVVVEADVVERELERLTRRLEERGDFPGDVDRLLPAVRQGVDLDRLSRRIRA
jgi:hypothetical protein